MTLNAMCFGEFLSQCIKTFVFFDIARKGAVTPTIPLNLPLDISLKKEPKPFPNRQASNS